WAERRFQIYGMAAVMLGIVFVLFLFVTIFIKGASTFRQAYVKLEVFYDPQVIDPNGTRKASDISGADYAVIIRASLKARFPEVEGRKPTRELSRLVSGGATFDLRDRVVNDGSLIGQRETRWLLASDDVDQLLKGKISRAAAEENGAVSPDQLGWID